MIGLNPLAIVLPGLCVAAVMWLVIVGGLMASAAWRRTIEARLAHIDRRIDRISGHLGLDADLPPDVKRFRELLREGRKIDAIKEYREQHDVGLKEAKDAIDAVQREMWS